MTQIRNSRLQARPIERKGQHLPAKSGQSGKRAPLPSRATAQIEGECRKPTVQQAGSRKRRAPQQRRSRETRHTIVTAAEQLLIQVGYARASTNAIARRAGISVGSLYQYFDDKEAVYRAVVARHHDEMLPMIRTAVKQMAEPGNDLVTVTLALMQQMAHTNAKNPQLMFALEHELGWLEHEPDNDAPRHEQILELVQAHTALPSKETAVIAQLLTITVSHLSRWLVHGKPPQLDAELFIAATGRMLRALLSPAT
jgi:AcrR family transcriptional regulator